MLLIRSVMDTRHPLRRSICLLRLLALERQPEGSKIRRLRLGHFALVTLLVAVADAAGANLLGDCLSLYDAKQHDEARACFDRLAEQHPRTALPHYYIGVISSAKHRDIDAALAFARAVELESDFPGAHAELGMALYRLDEMENAESHLLEALLQGPEDADVLTHLGIIDRRRGAHERALKLFAEAAELEPASSARAWFEAARAEFERNDLEATKIYLERAIDSPGPPGSIRAAGQMLAQLDAAFGTPKQNVVGLSAGVGVEYDDNLSVTEADFASGVADTAGVFDAGIDLRLLRGPRLGLFVAYDFYQSVYSDVSVLNFQSHSPQLAVTGQIGPTRPRLEYRYTRQKIGAEPFLESHLGSFAIGLSPLPRWSVETGALIEQLKFDQSRARDADRWAVIVRSSLSFLQGDLAASLEWRSSWQDAVAAHFDYWGNTLYTSLSAFVPLRSRNFEVNLHYEFLDRGYLNITPRIGQPRNDQQHSMGATCIFPVVQRADLRLDCRHIRPSRIYPR